MHIVNLVQVSYVERFALPGVIRSARYAAARRCAAVQRQCGAAARGGAVVLRCGSARRS